MPHVLYRDSACLRFVLITIPSGFRRCELVAMAKGLGVTGGSFERLGCGVIYINIYQNSCENSEQYPL